jgi:hypothetical protein
MAKAALLYCATDKEVFDALASSRQHFSESTLLAMAKKRGIFYSAQTDRMQLCEDVSLLTFGFHDVAQLQAEFEKSSHGEKKTFMRINTALTLDELRTIAKQFEKDAEEEGDKVSSHNVGLQGFAINVKYEEVDFSKTRLRQRQKREAHLEFKVGEDYTVITLPSNEKARQVAQSLIERASKEKKQQVAVEEVDLSWITDYELRTKFFQDLIRKVPGFALEDVTDVKVDFGDASPADDDLLEDTKAKVEKELQGVVKAMALRGKSLLLSEEYKRLKSKGFFITSIQWSGRRIAGPNEIVEFDAGFDNPAAGVGYRYGVRTWITRRENNEYAKYPATIPAEEKVKLSSLLQQASMSVFREIKEDFKKKHSSTAGEPL